MPRRCGQTTNYLKKMKSMMTAIIAISCNFQGQPGKSNGFAPFTSHGTPLRGSQSRSRIFCTMELRAQKGPQVQTTLSSSPTPQARQLVPFKAS